MTPIKKNLIAGAWTAGFIAIVIVCSMYPPVGGGILLSIFAWGLFNVIKETI